MVSRVGGVKSGTLQCMTDDASRRSRDLGCRFSTGRSGASATGSEDSAASAGATGRRHDRAIVSSGQRPQYTLQRNFPVLDKVT